MRPAFKIVLKARSEEETALVKARLFNILGRLRPKAYCLLCIRKGKLLVQVGEHDFVIHSNEFFLVWQCPDLMIKSISWPLKYHIYPLPESLPAVFHKALAKDPDCIGFSSGAFQLRTLSMAMKCVELILQLIHQTDKESRSQKSQNRGYELIAGLAKHLLKKNLIVGKYESYTSRPNFLVLQFLKLIPRHIREEHTVSFYAGQLCVSRGYLTKTLKVMGYNNPKSYIQNALLLEANELLGNSNLSILEISEVLNFSSASSFAVFFCKLQGTSPSAYRNNLTNQADNDT